MPHMFPIAAFAVLSLHQVIFCRASCSSQECLEEDLPGAVHLLQLKGASRRHQESGEPRQALHYIGDVLQDSEGNNEVVKTDTRRHWRIEGNCTQEPGIGKTANVTEEGYLSVAKLCCNYQMEIFVRRVIHRMGLKICEEGGLSGTVPWFTCEEHSIRSLARLQKDLLKSSQSANYSGYSCGFVTDIDEDCIPPRPPCGVKPKDGNKNPFVNPGYHRRRVCTTGNKPKPKPPATTPPATPPTTTLAGLKPVAPATTEAPTTGPTEPPPPQPTQPPPPGPTQPPPRPTQPPPRPTKPPPRPTQPPPQPTQPPPQPTQPPPRPTQPPPRPTQPPPRPTQPPPRPTKPPPLPTEPPKMCTGKYKSCGAWGDPHWTTSFFGEWFDFMGLGLYDIASSKDGRFQLQGYMSPYKKFGTSIFTGLALKLGDTRLTIIGKNYTINGKQFTGTSHASGIQIMDKVMKRDKVHWTSADKCSEFISEVFEEKVKDTAIPGKYSDDIWYYTFFTYIHEDHTAAKGICGSKTARSPIHRRQSLFSDSELDWLCKFSKNDDCVTFKPPKNWVPLNGPKAACQKANIDYNKAAAKCASLKDKPTFFSSCIFDYCASDGLDTVVGNAEESKKADEEAIPPPAPCVGEQYCLRRGPGINYCAGTGGNLLKPSAGSSGLAECKARCNKNKECNFISFWTTGGEGYCQLTKNCDVVYQQSHKIVVHEKPSGASAGATAGAGAGASEPELLNKGPGPDYCAEDIVWEGATKGQADCEGKFQKSAESKFMSFWTSSNVNYCRITRTCDVFHQQAHKIIIREKAG